jgi:hypothetical protein
VCDIAENCDGTNKTCPGDAKEPATTECRASAGTCDIAENCNGSGNNCPSDVVRPPSFECRASGGICDIAENCDGTNPTCPANQVRPDTFLCRGSAGVCDIVDYCNGVNVTCPADQVEPASTECRGSTGECDLAENCDGVGVSCPANGGLPDGTPCTDDGDECTDDECSSLVCIHPVAPVVCNDGNVCGAEECDIGMGNPDDCTVPETCQTDCTCGISTCDGSGSAPDCTDVADCASPTCPVDQPGDCYELVCEGGGTDNEFQICSEAASGGKCVSTSCTGDDENGANAVGTDCLRSSGSNSHSYTFTTQSPSGTQFMIWQRIYMDTGWDSGEQYNCSLTGVNGGGTMNFSLVEGPLNSGTHGADCDATNNNFCWASYNLAPVILDQGSHTLSCSISTNRSTEWGGHDGLIYTTDLAYVPDVGSPACDNDAQFTGGTCDTPPLNWGPNEYTVGGTGKCNSNSPLSSGTPCDDGLACNVGEDCDGAGACTGGGAPTCDDGVACTDDSCVEPSGCIYTPNDSLCADDGNPCTVSVCDVLLGCQINNVSNGTPCTIDTCSSTCLNGVCAGSAYAPVACAPRTAIAPTPIPARSTCATLLRGSAWTTTWRSFPSRPVPV